MGIVIRWAIPVTMGMVIAAAVCATGCDRQESAPAVPVVARHTTAPDASQPARTASEKAGKRAEGLKNSDSYQIELRPIAVAGMKHLYLDSSNAKRLFPVPVEAARISPEQRRAIIDYLAVEGFLDNAVAYDMANPQYKGPTIVLRVYWGKGFYDEDLGWNLKMLNRLDGLRRVLTGDAGKAIDRFLAQLQPQRKEWIAAALKPTG